MKKYWAALLVVCGALVAGVLLLALVGYAPPASLLPTTTRGLVTTLEGHEKAILDVAFSGDGLMLASGSADTSARLWNVATGKQIAVIRGHPATVYAVAFSPDDEFLASVSGLVWAPAPPLRFGESDAAPTPTQIPDVLMSSSNGVILWQLATNTVKTYWGFGTPMFAAAFTRRCSPGYRKWQPYGKHSRFCEIMESFRQQVECHSVGRFSCNRLECSLFTRWEAFGIGKHKRHYSLGYGDL